MVANNPVMEEDLEWAMAVDGGTMVSGVGAERTMVGIATVAVTTEAVCTMDLTSGHLDIGVSLVRKK
jgi:hypothetical protein